ncbi:hypothetical protein ACIQU8_06625 [Streptomyces griseus]|uniref:hypothetical protein n=1 Tax=Streptomyces griseus TaxID=1911 RepID=UPI003819BD1F
MQLTQMIDDLNRTPQTLIEEARELQGFARTRLLRSRTTPRNHPFLDLFAREVIDGDTPSEEWGRGGILVPDLSIEELLEIPPSHFLNPLRRSEFSAWKYVQMKGAVDRYDPNAGAPAALYNNLHYSWWPPENVIRISPNSATLAPAEPLYITVRRWIAFRVSLVLAPISSVHSNFTVSKVLEETGGVSENLSHDARAAIEGLLWEFRTDAASNSVHGYLGPVAFYEE